VVLGAALALALVARAPTGLTQGAPAAGYGAPGFRPERGYFTQAPFERVDMVNGDLLLSFTDLSLPGNAGMDLNIVRTFDQQRGGWHMGVAGVPLWITDPDGAVFDPETGQWTYPTLVTADGVAHTALPEGGDYVTDVFWRYSVAGYEARLGNGWTARFREGDQNRLSRLDEVEDPFGNKLIFDWTFVAGAPFRLNWVKQTFEQANRELSFTYDASSGNLPKTMTFLGRTWTYTYTGGSLMVVQPPAGPSWSFAYLSNPAPYGATRVTTPGGGIVTYEFAARLFPFPLPGDPDHTLNLPVVDKRITSGTVPGGTWTFTYTPEVLSAGEATGLVEDPDGRFLKFVHDTVAGTETVALKTHTFYKLVEAAQVQIRKLELQHAARAWTPRRARIASGRTTARTGSRASSIPNPG
jgi:hypothetical protein